MAKGVRLFWLIAAMALALLTAGPALAIDKNEARLEVDKAAILVQQFMGSPDSNAPRWLLRRSKAVVIIPDMVKAGFVVGGKYGHGVVVARKADGTWSPPSFIRTAGASVGFQIGAQAMDLFMVVVNQKGLDGILNNQVKFGVDASVVAGPWGRATEAGLSAASLKADIYSYSRSKGAFAGASLEGSGIETDAEANKAYYGRALSVREILTGNTIVPPAEAARLIQALTHFDKLPLKK
jgi:lipid-binding SYLF domain-containing protein